MSKSSNSINYLVNLSTEPLAYVTVIVVVIALLSIALRAWAQWGTERAWSAILVAAMVCVTAGAGLNMALLRYGFNGPTNTPISFDQIKLLTTLAYSICITYALSLNLAKLTVLEMYLQIFQVHNTRKWIILLGAVSTANCLANIFTVVFQCKPIRRAWLGTTTGTCIDLQTSFVGFAVVNIVLDILIPIVPAFGVIKLQGDVGRKTLAVVMLLLGSATVVASAYRLYLLVTPAPITLPNPPGARLTTWSTIESAAAVTSSCLPLLKPLGRRAVLKFKRTFPSSTQAPSNSPTSTQGSGEKFRPRAAVVGNVDSTCSTVVEVQSDLHKR